MSNLQDVMDNDLFPTNQPLSSVPSVGTTLSASSVSGNQGSNSLLGANSSLFSGKDGLSAGFGMSGLNSDFGNFMSRPLSSSSKGFMLNSFDNEDYPPHCRTRPPLLTRPALSDPAVHIHLLHPHERSLRGQRHGHERLRLRLRLLPTPHLLSRSHLPSLRLRSLASPIDGPPVCVVEPTHDAVALLARTHPQLGIPSAPALPLLHGCFQRTLVRSGDGKHVPALHDVQAEGEVRSAGRCDE